MEHSGVRGYLDCLACPARRPMQIQIGIAKTGRAAMLRNVFFYSRVISDDVSQRAPPAFWISP